MPIEFNLPSIPPGDAAANAAPGAGEAGATDAFLALLLCAGGAPASPSECVPDASRRSADTTPDDGAGGRAAGDPGDPATAALLGFFFAPAAVPGDRAARVRADATAASADGQGAPTLASPESAADALAGRDVAPTEPGASAKRVLQSPPTAGAPSRRIVEWNSGAPVSPAVAGAPGPADELRRAEAAPVATASPALARPGAAVTGDGPPQARPGAAVAADGPSQARPAAPAREAGRPRLLLDNAASPPESTASRALASLAAGLALSTGAAGTGAVSRSHASERVDMAAAAALGLPGVPPPPPAPVISIAAPVATPQWRNEVTQQLATVVLMGHDRAELQLHPAELGPIEVKVSMEAGQATLLISAPQPATRDALELALPQLRDALAQQGIALGQATVQDERPRDPRESRPSGRDPDRALRSATAPLGAATAGIVRPRGLVDTFA